MQEYYKKMIDHYKEELRKVYITAIADLLEKLTDNTKSFRHVYCGNSRRIKSIAIVWVDKYHVNTNETEVEIEYPGDDALLKTEHTTLRNLDLQALEALYNSLSYEV